MSKSYFEMVKSTYIENWPVELQRLSIAQVRIPLSKNETCTLGSKIMEYGVVFYERYRQYISEDRWEGLKERINKELFKFPNGAFIRLGSRSPKDSWTGYKEGFRVTDADKALRLLTDSERIYEDLMLALQEDYLPSLFLRQWIRFEPWQEFRCFMKNRRLAGISQYNYLHNTVYEQIERYKDTIRWAIEERFFPHFREVSHLDNVIFDVVVFIKERGNERMSEVKLLEINPFFEMTDPCLFNWTEEFDGSFRYIRRK